MSRGCGLAAAGRAGRPGGRGGRAGGAAAHELGGLGEGDRPLLAVHLQHAHVAERRLVAERRRRRPHRRVRRLVVEAEPAAAAARRRRRRVRRRRRARRRRAVDRLELEAHLLDPPLALGALGRAHAVATPGARRRRAGRRRDPARRREVHRRERHVVGVVGRARHVERARPDLLGHVGGRRRDRGVPLRRVAPLLVRARRHAALRLGPSQQRGRHVAAAPRIAREPGGERRAGGRRAREGGGGGVGAVRRLPAPRALRLRRGRRRRVQRPRLLRVPRVEPRRRRRVVHRHRVGDERSRPPPHRERRAQQRHRANKIGGTAATGSNESERKQARQIPTR